MKLNKKGPEIQVPISHMKKKELLLNKFIGF
jgi:hypothetical protein